MKGLRIALLSALGLIALIIHGLLAALVELIMKPSSHVMLDFGIYLWYTAWGFILVLPMCIGLGELWFKDFRRYIPHILLLITLSIWSANTWLIHPTRTLLFLTCVFLTLPLRWFIDRTLLPKPIG